MRRDNASTNLDLVTLSPQTLYRGLYVRVARKLRVDPSYVSRVARGERQSAEVEAALSHEIEQITRKLGGAESSQQARPRKKVSNKRLKAFVAEKRDSLRKEWLYFSQADPNIRLIKLSARRRVAPVIPVVEEALRIMDFSLKEIASKPMKAANKHGQARRDQGYTPTTLLEEYNLIRRCIYRVAEKHLGQLDPQLLVHDLGQLGEVLDLQSQSAIREFLARA